MCRFRRLKERKRKNSIKATTCGLALALVMGSAQGLGTYALFTDNVNITDKLSISTGDVDVYVTEGFNGDEINSDKMISKSFTIENHGTLRQKLQLKLSTNSNMSDYALKNINYILEMKQGEKDIIPIKLSLYDINQGKKFNLEYKTGGKVILNPGEIINCTSKIGIEKSLKKYIEKQDIDFDLNILASQVSYKGEVIDESHTGFIDLYKQTNKINIKQSDVDNLESNLTVELDDHEKYENYEIEIKAPKGKKFKNIEVEYGTGQFASIKLCEVEDDEFDIIKNPLSEFVLGENGIGKEYSEDHKLVISVEFITGEKEKWTIKFRYIEKNGKKVLKAYYTKTELAKDSDMIEPPKEEIETSNKLEAIEPPKEEIEPPNKPEAIEPPKEEIEIPNKPEAIEPPKEEVEVQNKPEVVEPSKEEIVVPEQTDIIAQKKE